VATNQRLDSPCRKLPIHVATKCLSQCPIALIMVVGINFFCLHVPARDKPNRHFQRFTPSTLNFSSLLGQLVYLLASLRRLFHQPEEKKIHPIICIGLDVLLCYPSRMMQGGSCNNTFDVMKCRFAFCLQYVFVQLIFRKEALGRGRVRGLTMPNEAILQMWMFNSYLKKKRVMTRDVDDEWVLCAN
jgi:hypothetical protein